MVMGLSPPFPSCHSLLYGPEGEFWVPSHSGNVALSLLFEPFVLNLLHVGITREALNITDDLVGAERF